MRVVGITAPSTDSGKTTVTLAILSKLKNSTGVKIGPDYIDGGISSKLTGNRTWNMDRWIQGRNYVNILPSLANNFDYAVVEGVMGMYDSGTQIDLSTHYYFEKLKIPYILVVDISKLAESAYYIASGFIHKSNIGVILNKYSSDKHLEMVSREFKKHGARIIGAIPNDKEYSIPQRHLGLYTSLEIENLRGMAEKISRNIDFSFIEKAGTIKSRKAKVNSDSHALQRNDLKIAVALDKAFNFYYSDSLFKLEELGKVQYFSPLKGESPDDPDFVYLGGGYPELYADELSSNNKVSEFLKNHSESGKPILAECGGLMYLEKEMVTDKGNLRMVGVFDGKVNKNSKLTLGYTKLKSKKSSILFRKGDLVYGHEFHYSTISDDSEKVLTNILGRGISGEDGIQVHNTLGTYSHFSLSRYFKRLYRLILENK
ncbi:MAG: cobyrinate a,c-diamide synthase [Thermoplasmatales archaeon]|nr:cobyrinate a,c-diamide synthase [Thermoplasmatales archaeon]MCW6169755.1 cobyrinate a,c-diamide synthase [Thermoplasmatales archaeon]